MVNYIKMKKSERRPVSLHWRSTPKLQRKEILQFGPQLVENPKKLSCPRDINPDVLYFVLKCVGDLIQHQKYFKFSRRQQKDVVKMCKPFESKLRKMANSELRSKHVNQMRQKSQRGAGVLTSLLISALVPLITSVINKVIKTKKK